MKIETLVWMVVMLIGVALAGWLGALLVGVLWVGYALGIVSTRKKARKEAVNEMALSPPARCGRTQHPR